MSTMNTEDSGFDEQSSMEDSPESSVKEIGLELENWSSLDGLKLGNWSSKDELVAHVKKTVEKNKRKPLCSFCKNHNRKELYIFGHKDDCDGQYCICQACSEVRVRQEKSAEDTKKTRAYNNFIFRQVMKIVYKIPKEGIPIKLDIKITPFQINWNLKSQVSEKKKENRKIKEEVASPLLSKKRKSNKRKSSNELRMNEQEKDAEEIIIFPRDFEKLLQYMQQCMQQFMLECDLIVKYDIRIIKSLMNEAFAIILKYAYAKITLDHAKHCISKLFIDETERMKLNESYYPTISSSNIGGTPFLEWTYRTHSYLNGLMPHSSYLPIWSNIAGSNAFPRLDNLLKFSTEPSTESSIYYRPITNGQ